jgi:hypothetical protein
MNNKSENENKKEAQKARTNPPGREARDAETAPPKEGSDFRETPERGYGWGV